MSFLRRRQQGTPKEIKGVEKICLEEHVYIDGNEVDIPKELRQKLYNVVLSCLPLTTVLDNGKTPADRQNLANEGKYRDAAAVSMKDPKILADKELQKEVKGYFEKIGFPVDELLQENQYALNAIYTFGHKHVENYTPKMHQETSAEKAQREDKLGEWIFGPKAKK